jgi:hypothetical protein
MLTSMRAALDAVWVSSVPEGRHRGAAGRRLVLGDMQTASEAIAPLVGRNRPEDMRCRRSVECNLCARRSRCRAPRRSSSAFGSWPLGFGATRKRSRERTRSRASRPLRLLSSGETLTAWRSSLPGNRHIVARARQPRRIARTDTGHVRLPLVSHITLARLDRARGRTRLARTHATSKPRRRSGRKHLTGRALSRITAHGRHVFDAEHLRRMIDDNRNPRR